MKDLPDDVQPLRNDPGLLPGETARQDPPLKLPFQNRKGETARQEAPLRLPVQNRIEPPQPEARDSSSPAGTGTTIEGSTGPIAKKPDPPRPGGGGAAAKGPAFTVVWAPRTSIRVCARVSPRCGATWLMSC